MKLFAKAITDKLLSNGREAQKAQEEDVLFDPKPVVKLFLPEGGTTWLLSELDPDNPDIAFGLCDLGMGYPELGSVSIKELESLRSRQLGLPVERDMWFEAHSSLSWYGEKASEAGCIQTVQPVNV